MIDKKEFVKTIKVIKQVHNNYEALRKISPDLSMGVGECGSHILIDTLIKVLCIDLGIKIDTHYGDTISWWIYETDYGKNDSLAVMVDNKKINIKTAEALYDFIVKYERLDKDR